MPKVCFGQLMAFANDSAHRHIKGKPSLSLMTFGFLTELSLIGSTLGSSFFISMERNKTPRCYACSTPKSFSSLLCFTRFSRESDCHHHLEGTHSRPMDLQNLQGTWSWRGSQEAGRSRITTTIFFPEKNCFCASDSRVNQFEFIYEMMFFWISKN